MHRIKFPLVTLILAAAFQLVGVGTASAITVTLTAEGVCVADSLGIHFRVTSDSPAGYTNSNVVISFNGSPVGGVYTLTGATPIDDTLPASGTPGGSVVVTATLGTWTSPNNDNGTILSQTVTLPTDCSPSIVGVGRFTGGGNTVAIGDVKFTRGFTIHCDLLLSNNLEINWPAAAGRQNQFHMLQHLTAECSDDPAIEQRPPRAPVDTIVGTGTGRFNGVAGYTITFTLVDAGEPGTSDQIGFEIRNPSGGVVVNLPLQNITGGNVQAHYDQPHRRNP